MLRRRGREGCDHRRYAHARRRCDHRARLLRASFQRLFSHPQARGGRGRHAHDYARRKQALRPAARADADLREGSARARTCHAGARARAHHRRGPDRQHPAGAAGRPGGRARAAQLAARPGVRLAAEGGKHRVRRDVPYLQLWARHGGHRAARACGGGGEVSRCTGRDRDDRRRGARRRARRRYPRMSTRAPLEAAILISGRGSNLMAIARECLAGHIAARVAVVISDRADAPGLAGARELGLETAVLKSAESAGGAALEVSLAAVLEAHGCDVIALAGFMRILSGPFVARYLGRMFNIHPSLLPGYRGLHTHRRVLEAHDTVHGASVHFVTAELDAGPVVLQSRVAVMPGDTEATLSARVQATEHIIYPRVLGWFAERPKTVSVLKLTAANVEPLSYKGDDGTGSTRRKVDVEYDWEKRRVTGVYEDAPVDLPLTPGVQDEASVQVALMVELLRGHTPERFELLDKNSVREYSYVREGKETLKTPFGDVPTVIYRSHRANSPHVNRYWCAPGRGYIPIRVEQKRGDDVQWTMEIRSLRRE